MTAYPALLGDMMNAILSRTTEMAATLYRDKKDFPASEQLAIYVEGYRLRLLEVITATYPALVYYIGDVAFRNLALGFIEATPSRYFNIDKYPIAFAEYVATQSDDMFARDLAKLESVIHAVYQAEESPVIAREWIMNQTPETLSTSPILLRTASELCRFSTAVNEYLTAFREDKKFAHSETRENYLFVLRHKNQVQRMALTKPEYELLHLLSEGKTLEAALEDKRLESYVMQENFPVELMSWFLRWVQDGFLRQPTL